MSSVLQITWYENPGLLPPCLRTAKTWSRKGLGTRLGFLEWKGYRGYQLRISTSNLSCLFVSRFTVMWYVHNKWLLNNYGVLSSYYYGWLPQWVPWRLSIAKVLYYLTSKFSIYSTEMYCLTFSVFSSFPSSGFSPALVEPNTWYSCHITRNQGHNKIQCSQDLFQTIHTLVLSPDPWQDTPSKNEGGSDDKIFEHGGNNLFGSLANYCMYWASWPQVLSFTHHTLTDLLSKQASKHTHACVQCSPAIVCGLLRLTPVTILLNVRTN